MKRTDTMVKMVGHHTVIKLILNTPNNKNISNINEVPFYEKFVKFYGKTVTKDIIMELEELKKEIELYCENEKFYALNGEHALELIINTYRKW